MPRTYTGALRTGLWSVLAAALGVVIAALGGCEHSADKSEIRRVYDEVQRCYLEGDAAAAEAILAPESFEMYDRLLPIALTGRKPDLMALQPHERAEVLMLRAKATRSEMKGKTGKDWFLRSISEGWWTGDGFELDIDDFQWWKDGDKQEAKARVYEISYEQRRSLGLGRRARSFSYDARVRTKTDQWLRFIKSDGVWKFDQRSMDEAFGMWMKNNCGSYGMTVDEFVVEYVAASAGLDEKLPESIWKPMK